MAVNLKVCGKRPQQTSLLELYRSWPEVHPHTSSPPHTASTPLPTPGPDLDPANKPPSQIYTLGSHLTWTPIAGRPGGRKSGRRRRRAGGRRGTAPRPGGGGAPGSLACSPCRVPAGMGEAMRLAIGWGGGGEGEEEGMEVEVGKRKGIIDHQSTTTPIRLVTEPQSGW